MPTPPGRPRATIPAASHYSKTLRATALVTLALGALAARRAAAIAAAGGAAGTAVRIAAAAGAEADADRRHRDAQARRDALLQPLERGIQVSHASPPSAVDE